MTVKKNNDTLLKVSRVLGIIIASSVIIGMLWAKIILPEIDKRIEPEVAPLRNSIQYNSFMLQELSTVEQIDRATKRYNAWKTGAGELN